MWVLSREVDRSIAITQGRWLLEMPNLSILDVEAERALGMLSMLERHEALTPRDAIHLAVMDS